VSKIISSTALEPINKALGIAGAGDSQTELSDGLVDQTLDVGQLARRGGTLAGTEGIFRIVLRNDHAGAGDLFTSFQPYSAGATGSIAPFPNVIPDKFDFWLLGASIETEGAGSLQFATLRLTNVQQGFGIDDSAAAVVSTAIFTLAYWNTSVKVLAPFFAASQSTLPYQKLNMRIPRKGAIASPFIAFSSQADGVSEIDCCLLCGVFPVALGQDVAQ